MNALSGMLASGATAAAEGLGAPQLPAGNVFASEGDATKAKFKGGVKKVQLINQVKAAAGLEALDAYDARFIVKTQEGSDSETDDDAEEQVRQFREAMEAEAEKVQRGGGRETQMSRGASFAASARRTAASSLAPDGADEDEGEPEDSDAVAGVDLEEEEEDHEPDPEAKERQGLIDDYKTKEKKIDEIRSKVKQELQELGLTKIEVDVKAAKDHVANYFDAKVKEEGVPGAEKDKYRKGARVLRDDYNEDND